MANYIEIAPLDSRRFITASSRYVNNIIYYYSENKFLTFEVYKKKPIPNSDRDKYYVISSGTEYRPDLVSQKAYGTPDFWWKIMEANNIKDVFDFKAGLNIRIPDTLLG
jgi:hypothetical protein